MYKIGDQVLYGAHGVCRIVGLESKTVDRRTRQYYVLEPTTPPSAQFYVPTDNQAAVSKMKTLLSEAELLALLHSPAARQDCWIPDENQRKLRYKELISGADRTALFDMMGTLYRHKLSQQAAGRKFHQCDDTFLHDAKRLLCSEFSAVLRIPFEQVPAFLQEQLGKL